MVSVQRTHTYFVKKHLTTGSLFDRVDEMRNAGVKHLGGSRWEIRVKVVDPKTGRPSDAKRIIEANGLKEARAARAAFLEERRTGDAPTLERVRLSIFADTWFAERAPTLKHSTSTRYAEILNIICNGVPAAGDKPAVRGIGDRYLDALEPTDVKAWLADAAKRYSGYTCLAYLRLLRTVTKDAQRALRLPHWACDGVKRPKELNVYTVDEPNALTPAELWAVLDCFRRTESTWYAYCLVAAYTGLRPCEVGALKWGDLDPETGALRVHRTVYRGVVSARGKTKNAQREVVLPPEVLAELRPLIGDVKAWMFARPGKDGAPRPPSDGVLSEPLGRVLVRLKIAKRVTPYAFRRTMNTIALRLAPAELVRKVIGHAPNATEMTERYLAPDHDARASLASSVFAAVAKSGRKVEGGEGPN